ncbi:toprim domain-containing protein [archaeon]|nr:toprim domain-containing protein [archaeon]
MKSELEIFKELIKYLQGLSCPIIVEGPRDVAALEAFGISNLHPLSKSLEAEAEEIASDNKEVVILSDLDPRGKRIYSVLSGLFTKMGVKVLNKPRELLFQTKLRQVEGLYHRVRRLEES